MRITQINIKNYRSFGPDGQDIFFPTHHCALVGKNNAGKSNIFNALKRIFGYKNPVYLPVSEEDFFNSNKPIEIKIIFGDFKDVDSPGLFALANLYFQKNNITSEKTTKPMKGALAGCIKKNTGKIIIEYQCPPLKEIKEDNRGSIKVNLWGWEPRRGMEDIRKAIICMLLVPAVRDHKDELSVSRWTQYGQLMKEIFEGSVQYPAIKKSLTNLNKKIQDVFGAEKEKLLKTARTTSYVDDIEFRLTRENNPSELLRNLEIFVKEGTRLFNIDYVGTGTQSAIIIAILELALNKKVGRNKLFCIEEPEVFIHPHGIRYLGALVKNITAEQNTQVIVSTHSLSLVTNFEPREIIRIDKVGGSTTVRQNPDFDSTHYKRFIHEDSAELFFSDRVVFVEGDTEKHLLCNLDKNTKQNISDLDTSDPNNENCNFDKINVGIIRLGSSYNILNYIKIAESFNIEFSAILDKDFLKNYRKTCENLCKEIGVHFQTTDLPKLITDLKNKNILINTKGKGEIEDLFSNQEIANITGRSITDVQGVIGQYPSKTSDALKNIFGTGKTEYAIKIAEYYIEKKLNHPLEDLIRKLYKNDILHINF